MQAVRFHEFGPADVLRVETLPVPEPAVGEVLVRVAYAGVNPFDARLRAGLLRNFRPVELPFVLGTELAGVVAKGGPGVSEWAPGTPVFGLARGAYAEYALASASDLQRLPPSLPLREAAAVPQGALTAWKALEAAGLGPGGHLLVQGAAGGVGSFVVQLAIRRGLRVWGTCSHRNAGVVAEDGAQALAYDRPGWAGPERFDAVIDAVGGDVLSASAMRVVPGGSLISLAHPLPRDFEGIRAQFIHRSPASVLGQLLPDLDSGILRPRIRAEFSWDDVVSAHRLCETGHGAGRILLNLWARSSNESTE